MVPDSRISRQGGAGDLPKRVGGPFTIAPLTGLTHNYGCPHDQFCPLIHRSSWAFSSTRDKGTLIEKKQHCLGLYMARLLCRESQGSDKGLLGLSNGARPLNLSSKFQSQL